MITEAPKESRYLNATQIDAVKSELEKVEDNFTNFGGILSLIDTFVRNNETADSEYEALYKLVRHMEGLIAANASFDPTISSTFPLISAISIYDFLVFVGVVSFEDFKQMRNNGNFMNKGGIPKA